MVGQILRAEMARTKGQGQIWAASVIGHSQSYVSDRLDGKAAFTIDDLALLCRALSIRPSAVIREAESRLKGITPLGDRNDDSAHVG